MTLRETRVLWTRLKDSFVLWIAEHPEWEVAEGEGYVALSDPDPHRGPHRAGGAHYLGTGGDLLLYIGGYYVVDGDDPAWRKIGAKWESLHPLCKWGGRFDSLDANHMSVFYEGIALPKEA